MYAEVTEFQTQSQQVKHRYTFLVLSAPSRLGNTVFARSLCPARLMVLEIHCALGVEPDLTGYRLSRHGLLLFDEVEAGQVTTQRKFFQAQAAPVQLGCSATNCHNYEVFGWCKSLVLCTNTWHSSLAHLAKEDQAWIAANSVVLEVASPMWIK